MTLLRKDLSSLFERNLDALALFDSRSAACIKRFERPSANTGLHNTPAQWTGPALKAGDTVVLFGSGDGSELTAFLSQPLGRGLIVECDMQALAGMLAVIDLSDALSHGRLRFLLMPETSAVSREISLRECNVELVHVLFQPQGSLHFVSTSGSARHASFYEAVRGGVQQALSLAGKLSQARAATPSFDVTVISPCCAIFDDLAQCFGRLGLKTQLLRVPDVVGTWNAEQREAAQIGLASAASRLVITRNRALFECEQASSLSMPEALLPGNTLMWWWDVPNLAHHIEMRHARGEGRAYGFARDILPLLPQGAEWLPPGARTPFVEAGMQPEIEQNIKVSFVGQSRLQGLHANITHLGKVLQDLGGNASVLGKDLARARGYVGLHAYLVKHQPELRSAIDALSGAYPAHAYYLNYVLDMAVTGAFRIAAIEHLMKEGTEIAVYGDEDWLKVEGVTSKQFKGLIAPADLPNLFRRSKLNLNLNFMQVSSTINPKVLDIVAAGGVALTDYRPELDVLYSDPAVRPFAFHALEQLSKMIDTLLKLDLRHYRQAVREHTCRHHTLQQRALHIAHRYGLLQSAQ